MGILSVVLLVFFVIVAVLLILLVLIQNDEGGGIGGMFGGGADTAFGSRSGNFLTRATTVLGSLFLIISLSLAFLSRTPAGSGVEEEARRIATDDTGANWLQRELDPSSVPVNENAADDVLYNDIYNEGFSGDSTQTQ